MSAPAVAGVERPTLSIRGTSYPVLLPTLRDPRLHLAAVIVSLQVLGQAAFGFQLSIAQILVALLTSALLEFAIAFRRQRVIMWPASALLTGNGVAFVLRVPGTEHGDWWSLRGWWIFAGTAAVALLSKHLIRYRGSHLFNPSNLGLVVCFLALGKDRADPLDFWWAPMSVWLALALAIIVAGGLVILSRLGLLGIAVGFWLAFAAGIGVLALSGHGMVARWHLGVISGEYFWRVLVFSPEVLVFLFFMITDPKTIPEGRVARRVYAVSVGLLATLLIAPVRTEFWSKVALLGALAIVGAARPLCARLRTHGEAGLVGRIRSSRRAFGVTALAGAAAFSGLLVVAGLPARSDAVVVQPLRGTNRIPEVTVLASKGVASQLKRPTALVIARSLVSDLQVEADALRSRDPKRARAAATGNRLADLRRRIESARGKEIEVPTYSVERMRVRLERGAGQGPPVIVADLTGTMQLVTYAAAPGMVQGREQPARFERTLLLVLDRNRYLITGERGQVSAGTRTSPVPAVAPISPAVRADFASVHLQDVAAQVGLDFRQDSFRFGMSSDPEAMMGGGLCWLDYDNDGWMDLFVVNSYSDQPTSGDGRRAAVCRERALPQRAREVRGRQQGLGSRPGCPRQRVRRSRLQRGRIYGSLRDAPLDDVLLWNNGDGTFTEGARAAGVVSFGWRTGAAVADVNGDGRPDLFVAGLHRTSTARSPSSTAGFPTNHLGVRDLFFLNEGLDKNGHSKFPRGRQASRARHAASSTASAPCSPTSTATDAPTSTSPTTRIRTGST